MDIYRLNDYGPGCEVFSSMILEGDEHKVPENERKTCILKTFES